MFRDSLYGENLGFIADLLIGHGIVSPRQLMQICSPFAKPSIRIQTLLKENMQTLHMTHSTMFFVENWLKGIFEEAMDEEEFE